MHACVHVRVSFLYHSLPTVVEGARVNVDGKSKKTKYAKILQLCVYVCVYILRVHNVHKNIMEHVFVCLICLPSECVQMFTCKYYIIITGEGRK